MEPRPSELLKSNRTGLQSTSAISQVLISHCDATHPGVRKAVGAVHTFSVRYQQVRQYRGTQPHSTESTMTSVELIAGSFRQSQAESVKTHI